MGDYEYRTEKLPSLRDSKKLAKLVRKYGERGWELVDKQEGGLIVGSARVTFRRPKPEPSTPAPKYAYQAPSSAVRMSREEVAAGYTEEQVRRLNQIKTDVTIGRITQEQYEMIQDQILKSGNASKPTRKRFW